jgi:5-methylthioadenosine/S-adenosylhomocysteine deaminase
VWSPFSNLLLYGETANVKAAKAAGVLISLAPDWSPTGSKSMLGELKIADVLNRTQLDRLFSDPELVAMVTRNPAIALGWGHIAGQIAPEFIGDVIVVDAIEENAHRNLIRATETHVKLVIVRGEPLYGDATVMRTLKTYPIALPDGATKLTRQYELLTPRLPGRQKAVDFKRADVDHGDVAVKDMTERLERAMKFNRGTLRQRIPASQVRKDLAKAKCKAPPPASPPSTEDFQRFLKCEFPGGLPATPLDPLFTVADDDFFRRLDANPNIPQDLRSIRDFYRTP